MNRLAALALLATVAGAPAANAQIVLTPTVRITPQYVSYHFGGTVDKTISEFAVPLTIGIPVTQHFSFDVNAAYASATSRSSSISGLTDTQIRGNYSFGNDNVVFTAGVNLPTGQETVDLNSQGEAAGQIGNDFLAFPVSNFGTGLAGTGGVAFAKSMGDWNAGIGFGARVSTEYDAYSVNGATARFQPGTEFRVRAGADRPFGDGGRLALGFTYAAFQSDQSGSFLYNTGDRYIGQAAISHSFMGTDLSVSTWDLYRTSGNINDQSNISQSKTLPWENIVNLAIAQGYHVGFGVLEPNIELRAWSRDGANGGVNVARMAQFGLRSRSDMGAWSVSPSASFAIGRFQPEAADQVSMNGFRGALTVRWTR